MLANILISVFLELSIVGSWEDALRCLRQAMNRRDIGMSAARII